MCQIVEAATVYTFKRGRTSTIDEQMAYYKVQYFQFCVEFWGQKKPRQYESRGFLSEENKRTCDQF